MKKVIIIGAGIGGLSAAIRLAAVGHQVDIYEQNAQVGGKMGEITEDGYRWDTGPSVITMRHVFEELFEAAGRRFEDYVNLLPIDPLTRYFYPDGSQIDIRRGLADTLSQIEAIEPRDSAGYLRYLAYAATIHRITGPVFIYDQPPTLSSFLSVPLSDMLKVDAWRRMHGAIRSFVKSPQMRQLLGRFATYVGASPYLAPATLNVIAHVELNGGVWYPQGGIYTIAAGMARLAQELGVRIHTNAPVDHIEVEGDVDGRPRVSGVRLNGDWIEADAVIANVDVATVYKSLLNGQAEFPKTLRRLTTAAPSCSGLIMLLGVEGHSPGVAHHNIFFSRDYRAEFDSIFKQGVMPADPTIYVAITSKTDPAHAPEGHENWFVLLNAPPLGDRWDWSTQTEAYQTFVLRRLAEWGLPLHDRIQVQKILTPVDIAHLTGAYRGALYGPSSNDPLAAFRRTHNRSKDIRGLYFAGGTTHPGGGVPMVTLSGKVAAEMVLEDWERKMG